MEVRQIRKLSSMSERDRLRVIAEGLIPIADNARDLLSEAEAAAKAAPRMAYVAESLAGEEAGKALLLIDYLRPYHGIDEAQRGKHLKGFYSHLTRGIYSRYFETSPADFREVVQIVDGERASHYLDGPEAVEWVFRNRILQRREEILYVDYVEREGDLAWASPPSSSTALSLKLRSERWRVIPPASYRMMDLLLQAGLLSVEALEILGAIWRDVEITPDSRRGLCDQLNGIWIKECGSRGIIRSDESLAFIRDDLLFPLCGIDLTEVRVRKELEEIRENTVVDYS